MSRTELYIGIGGLIITSLLANAALSESQKKWVKRRDGGRCQAKGIIPHREDERNPHEIHHIGNQGEAKARGFSDEDIDNPRNVLEICRGAHDQIHPDTPNARRTYYQDKKAFEKLEQERREKLKRGQPYHNTQYDSLLSIIANRNTSQYEREHPDDPFPQRRRR